MSYLRRPVVCWALIRRNDDMARRKKRPHNRFITVYQQLASASANTDGGFDESATSYCQRWCTAFPLRGTEPKAMEAQQALTEWIVRMRFDDVTAAITTKMWIVLPGSERLNITSVHDPDGRRRDIEIKARQAA